MTFDPHPSLGVVTLTVESVTTGVTFSGPFHGSGGFTKAGVRSMILTNTAGTSTFSGVVRVAAGTLAVGASDSLQYARLLWSTADSPGSITFAGGTIGMIAGDKALAPGSIKIGGPSASPAVADGIYTGVLSGGGLITKQGPNNAWRLEGANTHTGGFTVSAGVLQAGSATAFGGTSGAMTAAGGTIDMQGFDVNKSAAALTLGSGSSVTSLYSSGASATYSTTGVTLTADAVIEATGALTLSTAGAVVGGGKLIKRGAGKLVWKPSLTSNYNGGTSIENGEIEISDQVPATGNACQLGTGGIDLTATLSWHPTAVATIARSVSCFGTNATLSAQSSATITVSGAITYSAANTRLTLLTQTSASFVFRPSSLALTGGATAASLRVQGPGTVTFDTTTVSVPTAIEMRGIGNLYLQVGLANVTSITMVDGYLGYNNTTGVLNYLPAYGNLNLAGGYLIGKIRANVVSASPGGVVNALLEDAPLPAAPTAVTVNAGQSMRLQPLVAHAGASGNNTYTGPTSISGLCEAVPATAGLDPAIGNGKAFGDSPVTVENGGHIQTKASFSAGRMRYQSLKFKAGSSLSIGAAA